MGEVLNDDDDSWNSSILNVSAIVLANLCVSYIMTSQNEEAEELMRKIEKEEEQLAYEDPDKKVFHLCIVNLVIGERVKQTPPASFSKCDVA